MCRPGLCERAARQRRLPQELPQPARHGAQRRRGRALAQGPAPEGGGEGAQLVALAAAPLLRAGKLCQALGDGPERHRPRFPRKRDAQPPGQRPQRRRWRSVSGLGPQQRRQRALRPTGGVLGRAAGEQGGDARGDLALASTNRIPLRHTDDLQERLRPSHGPRTTHPPGQGTVHAEGERVQVGALRHRPLEQFGSAPGRASRAKDGQYIHIECGRLPCPRASTLLNCPQQVAEQHLPRWHEFILVRSVLHIPCCSGIAAQRSSASCKALVANSRTPGKTPSASSWARATRPSTALKTGTNDSTTACKGNEIFKATASRSKRIKFPTWNFATFRASPAEPCRKSGWPDMGAPKAATSAAAAAWAASSTAARETAASHAASRQRSFKKRQARFCRGREPSNSATRVRVRHS
mmetsp:Transcript_5215/g.19598  ORF Transcript_5215/g.19598 Transcript_5215/m.19598 type:complete len:410 (+) Transcript_5215:1021-2250(+)